MEPQAKRALVVDAEYLQGEMAATNLEDAGFVVNQETYAADASFLLLEQQQARFDIALVKFPFQESQAQDTVELLNILRELSVPRVVVSALSREELALVYPLQGGEGYIGVPHTNAALSTVVAKTLGDR